MLNQDLKSLKSVGFIDYNKQHMNNAKTSVYLRKIKTKLFL